MSIEVIHIPNTRRLVGAIRRDWSWTLHKFVDKVILIDITDLPF